MKKQGSIAKPEAARPYCSFCGERSGRDFIIASAKPVDGKHARICDACTALCAEYIAADRFISAIKAGATNVTRLRSRAPRAKPALEVVA